MKKIDLKDCTFIIPLKIESEDREQNFRFVMKYFHDNIDTNIIITESSHNDDLILRTEYDDILNRTNTVLIERPDERYFRRTHYLNEMLKLSKTPITVNYDIDVFLPLPSYAKAQQMIRDGFDVVYPFGYGPFQMEVPQDYRDEMLRLPILTKIQATRLLGNLAEYGHAQFFNTESYRKGYGENEEFVSYGPEDQERFYRFKTLGYKVTHMDGDYVFHLNHSRGRDSARHKNYQVNCDLWEKLKGYDKEQLVSYYKSLRYTKKL